MYSFFSNVFIVNGANKSTINDLTSQKVYTISNDVALFFQSNKDFDFDLINDSKVDGLRDIVDILISKNMITKIDLSQFPDLNNNYETSGIVDHGIIDFSKESNFSIVDIQGPLAHLGIKHLQIRFYHNNYSSEIGKVLKVSMEKSLSIVSYEIMINYFKDIDLNVLLLSINEFTRLRSVVIFYSNDEPIVNLSDLNFIVHFTKGKLINQKCCGNISKNYFMLNMKNYMESQNFNNCLNRKISIDINGDIKNCPSMPESYGNIKETTLEDAINQPGFKKYWNITKDQIDICKDCEFRYVCTDCRAYTERTTFKEDIDLSKPLKCGYNPYTNEWAEWSTNPLKEKAITYYGMQELVKKND